MKYNVVIIGAGQKGALADIPGSKNDNKYLSYAHAVKENQSFELIGFYDIDKEKQELAEKIWLKGKSKNINPDIIIITTPDDQHAKSLYQVLMYNPKLVILEKPVPKYVGTAVDINKQYKKRNIPVLVDYTRRFIPFWQNIRQKILDNEYGDFKKGVLYFNRGLYHTASHFVDLCNFFGIKSTQIELNEVDSDYRWVFDWNLFFEKDFICEHAVDIKEKKISMYDNHLKHVIEHAANYLNRKCELVCTMDDGIKAIENLNKLEVRRV
jgi:hypothetical protein